MSKQAVKTEVKLSPEKYMDGSDVVIKMKGKVIVDLYVLPNGGMVIHKSGEILIRKENIEISDYKGESGDIYLNIKFKEK
jgi:hypothetical protein